MHKEYLVSQEDYREVLEGGKVSKTKPKAKEDVDLKTAFFAFQREERSAGKDFIEQNNADKTKTKKAKFATNFITDKWRKIKKDDKEEWYRNNEMKRASEKETTKATNRPIEKVPDKSTKTIDPNVNDHEIDINAGIHRIIKCQICGRLSLGQEVLLRHMLDKHRNTKDENVGDVAAEEGHGDDLFEDEEDKNNKTREDDVNKEGEGIMVEALHDQDKILLTEDDDAEDYVELVLVTKKSRQWPAKVISKHEDTIEVGLLNNAKRKVSLNKGDVEAYMWDTNLFKNGTSELKNAYKKAKEITNSLI